MSGESPGALSGCENRRTLEGPEVTLWGGPPCAPHPDLLSWGDEGVDVLQHGLQGAVVAHTQVLDLDLPLVRPVLRDQRGCWGPGWGSATRQGPQLVSRNTLPPRLPPGPLHPNTALFLALYPEVLLHPSPSSPS